MKKFFFGSLVIFAGFTFISIYASAQYVLSGRILDDKTQQPVGGAGISLQGKIQTGSYSSDDGYYHISGIPEGKYHLHISYLGYENFDEEITMNKDIAHQDIELRNTGLFVKPVEITSTRAGKNAPFTKTTLTADEISRINLGQDLPYLLNQQPSVMISSDAGAGVGYTDIWIRGTDATRINVTFNGIPVNDAESSGTFWVDFPDIASSAGSLQIQRGAGTSTNGAGAFGATINVSTNEFHEKPYGNIMSSYGSFNTWKHEVKAGSGLLNDHFTVDARLSDITSDGYIDRATSDLKSFYFSTAYFSAKTSLRLNVFSGKEKTYQAWDGVPQDSLKTNRTYNPLGLKPDGTFYKNQTDNYQQTYYQLFLNHEMNDQWDFSLAAFLTRGKGYYEEYNADQPYHNYGLPDPVIGNDTLTATDLINDLWLDNYFYGAIFSLNHTSRILNWTLGGGWDRYDGKHYGNIIWAEYAIPKDYQYYYNVAHKYDFNLYWKANKHITSSLLAFLDLQYRYVKYDINGFDDNPGLIQHNRYNFFNPKAGITYLINSKSSAYASYAVANKEPNRDDFEANRQQTPKPEHLGDLEAGYDRYGNIYHLHGNIYYMHYKNQLALTGKINDVGAYTRTNIPESYRMGIELNGDIRFAKIWTFSANTAFSRNKILNFTEYIDDNDNGKQKPVYHGRTDISFSPAVISGASVSAEPLKDLTISLSGKYVSRRYLDNTSELSRSLAPYFVSSMQFHYNWEPRWISSIDFDLLINNLFNVKYVTNGFTYTYISGGNTYTDNSYFPQAGTNFLAGINIHF
ncbi:MAG: TonB-dependent receptor [Chitinophagaceae bacterium]|nr:MAG: TonB-dependent receptor [Chitinophagaceae bacterium]